jgi:hypothetical protein
MQQLGLSLNAVHLHDVFEVRTAAGCLAAEGVCWRPLQSVSCQGMISTVLDSRCCHQTAGACIGQQVLASNSPAISTRFSPWQQQQQRQGVVTRGSARSMPSSSTCMATGLWVPPCFAGSTPPAGAGVRRHVPASDSRRLQ